VVFLLLTVAVLAEEKKFFFGGGWFEVCTDLLPQLHVSQVCDVRWWAVDGSTWYGEW